MRLLAGIEALRERLAIAIPGVAPTERERSIEMLRSRLGAGFHRAWQEGRALPERELVRPAVAEAARHSSEHRIPKVPTAAVHATSLRLQVRALGPVDVLIGGLPIDPRAWVSAARPRELLL